jgi:FtsP/CotA-like multicopper oxidase with cupredoxin domain
VIVAGKGQIRINIEVGTFETKAAKFTTRAIDGIIAGPTIKIKAGETLKVLYCNDLEPQASATNAKDTIEKPLVPNPFFGNLETGVIIGKSFGPPEIPKGGVITIPGTGPPGVGTPIPKNGFFNVDNTNMHWHGLHASGEAPSDDTYIDIPPRQCYQYVTEVLDDHMPGTNWYHPHKHGSSAVQLGGGAAGFLIVENDDYEVPEEVANAKDILVMVQDFFCGYSENRSFNFCEAVMFSLDDVVKIDFNTAEIDDGVDNFSLVNGQYKPNVRIVPGEWNRFRIAFATAGWRGQRLDYYLQSDGKCESYMLAKDGIFIYQYPERTTGTPDAKAYVPPGGRVDIMVRCNAEGTFPVFRYPNPLEEVCPDGQPARKPFGPPLGCGPKPPQAEFRECVNCDFDEFTTRTGEDVLLMNVISELPPGQTEIVTAPGPTRNFEFEHAKYLTDLRDKSVKEECKCGTFQDSCRTGFDGDGIAPQCNGKLDPGSPPDPVGEAPFPLINGDYFREDNYIHVAPRGEIVERRIGDIDTHPYHAHVQPIQIISGFETIESQENGWFKNGDFVDVLMTVGGKRFRPVQGPKDAIVRFIAGGDLYDGKIMLHCHRLDHEDNGMMTQELILREGEGNQCSCDYSNSDFVM